MKERRKCNERKKERKTNKSCSSFTQHSLPVWAGAKLPLYRANQGEHHTLLIYCSIFPYFLLPPFLPSFSFCSIILTPSVSLVFFTVPHRLLGVRQRQLLRRPLRRQFMHRLRRLLLPPRQNPRGAEDMSPAEMQQQRTALCVRAGSLLRVPLEDVCGQLRVLQQAVPDPPL